MDKKNCLIVVDMINGFINEGALSDKSITKCIPPILSLIKEFINKNQPILAFCDSHPENCKEFDSYPVHCLNNSHESQLVDEIKAYEDQMIVLNKNSTNGFVQPEFLKTYLSLGELEEVVVVGCCTDICVLQFALSLKGYINENNLNTKIVVPVNCVETFDAPGHEQVKFNEMAFKLLKNAGIELR